MNYNNLLEVSKPIRYINNEINAFHKNASNLYRFCLIFPDVYEIGMSHLGMKILYERLNMIEHIYAERFYMPWADALEKFGNEIFVSLETQRPLKEFDMIGFSLQYELSYTNVLQIIDKSGINVFSENRVEGEPIVVAGGPCALNPYPLYDFIDVFFMGEMEVAIEDVVSKMFDMKNASRREKLQFLDSFDFTFVPGLNDKKQVKRKIYEDFHKDITLKKPIVPLMPVVQDRVTVEISRGCTRGCRFCQAGMIYRPSRERNIEDIVANALEQIKNTGYLEVSLLSLSAADYSCLEELLIKMSKVLSEKMVSLSLPSIRADKVREFIFSELKRVRKSGFTIAPEAGSQKMRNIINKNLTEDEIIEAVKCASMNGFNSAKLYFMIGLPFEEDDDIEEIAHLALRIKKSVRKSFDVTVSVSNFVPKPFTPFQWYGQNSMDEFVRKQNIIKGILKTSKLKYKFHDPRQSIIEGSISRGGREISKVLYHCLKNNQLFDGWGEYFSFEKWQKAFEEASVTFEDTALRYYEYKENLPWDNIETGVEKDFLYGEFLRSKELKVTEDCRTNDCLTCGVCDFNKIKNIDALKPVFEESDLIVEEKLIDYKKIVILFEKKGLSSLFSAIDMTRIFSHSFKIAGVVVDYSKGFNPQPKLSYVFPLPVGVEGENEMLVTSVSLESFEKYLENLNSILPKGILLKEYKIIDNTKDFDAVVGRYRFDSGSYGILRKSIASDSAYYVKKNKKGEDKRVSLNDYMVDYGDFYIDIVISNSGTFNFVDFFKYINYKDKNIHIIRESLIPFKGGIDV